MPASLSRFPATKIALLQTKFNRLLRDRIRSLLAPFHLNITQWIVLGFLKHKKSPVSPNLIAKNLGVRMPYVTVTINMLEQQRLVNISDNPADQRSQLIMITRAGLGLLDTVDARFTKEMPSFFQTPISKTDLAAYLKVIEAAIRGLDSKNDQV
jgi:DNA-binding MarR family transcriptional regulator